MTERAASPTPPRISLWSKYPGGGAARAGGSAPNLPGGKGATDRFRQPASKAGVASKPRFTFCNKHPFPCRASPV